MERNGGLSIVVLDQSENVLAYCSSCQKPIFKGNDSDPRRKRVLKLSIVSHCDFFDGRHDVNVIH